MIMVTAQEMSRPKTAVLTLLLDGITPIAAFASLRGALDGPSILLESSPGAGQLARYSIIALGAAASLTATGGEAKLTIAGETERVRGEDVLDASRRMLAAYAPEPANSPFCRFLGAYGVAGFELAGYFEKIGFAGPSQNDAPDLELVIPRLVCVFDHFTHEVALLTIDADIAQNLPRIGDALVAARAPVLTAAPETPLVSVSPYNPFLGAVTRAKEAIAAGDVFQIVVSQLWEGVLPSGAFDAYRRLRSINPSPYMFYIEGETETLFGASPEMLCKLDGRHARIRPLAGTRARSNDPEAELRAARALRRDPKERAEHVMLVDLARNDLGRVCRYGTVRVSELFEIERYSHVMHLVSEVCGSLESGMDAFDLFAASFPAGTVSGAPKIRAMQLIAQLEGVRRGYYGGSVMRFGFDGSLDACITLRSAQFRDGMVRVRAGAGIVADSHPSAEDAECRAKARAVAQALRAEGGSPP